MTVFLGRWISADYRIHFISSRTDNDLIVIGSCFACTVIFCFFVIDRDSDDFVRIRRGIRQNPVPLKIVPSEEFATLLKYF